MMLKPEMNAIGQGESLPEDSQGSCTRGTAADKDQST